MVPKQTSHWKKFGGGLGAPTFWKFELQKLKDRGVIVHAYYVQNEAKTAFDKIAQSSGGRSGSIRQICALFEATGVVAAKKMIYILKNNPRDIQIQILI